MDTKDKLEHLDALRRSALKSVGIAKGNVLNDVEKIVTAHFGGTLLIPEDPDAQLCGYRMTSIPFVPPKQKDLVFRALAFQLILPNGKPMDIKPEQISMEEALRIFGTVYTMACQLIEKESKP